MMIKRVLMAVAVVGVLFAALTLPLFTPDAPEPRASALSTSFSVFEPVRSHRRTLAEQVVATAKADATGPLAVPLVTGASGVVVRAVPSVSGVCLTEDDGGSVCADSGAAGAGALYGADICSPNLTQGEVRLYGLIPNGISEVSVVTSRGITKLPVRGNGYIIETRDQPTAVRWLRPDGSLGGYDTPLPSLQTVRCAPSGGNPADIADPAVDAEP